ncbi:phospholipase A2-like protein [Trypanosoma grayi]|uniref:phospholipase A2-like protein n=1 Tax=Trypanosoma grayi TaxID=71804 RepID=UPI0004F427E3|nr:phospholipase A2-like protein [Trypanosoma grayi]KEG15185.1 phospholipase A2-like protein [Trypanosoma grayi]
MPHSQNVLHAEDMSSPLPNAVKGFFAGPPFSPLDYLTSLHTVPFTASVVAGIALRCHGVSPVWSALAFTTGLFMSVTLFVLLPLPILVPLGGRYHVGMVHVDGRRAQSLPPLAVFYPTDVPPPKKGVPYVPFNDNRFIRGIASYAGIPFYVLRDTLFVRLRVSPNATPVPMFNSMGQQLPIIVFSHGLSAYHRLYSCLLLDIAARGAIVVAVGHGDGSASFMRDSGSERNEVEFKHLNWEPAVREVQLVQRVKEIRGTLNHLTEGFWRTLGYAESDIKRHLSQPLRVHLSGHSFGGATMLATALQEEHVSKEGPVQSVFVFDPWHVPLQNECFYKPIADGRMKFTTPTHMIHSEQWVKDKSSWDFFQQVTDAVRAQTSFASLSVTEKSTRFVAERSGDANHMTASDISVLSPVLHGNTQAVVPPRVQIMEWSNALLRFARQHTPERGVTPK